MRNYTRFIPGEEIDGVAQWRFGAMDTASMLLAAQAEAREKSPHSAHSETARQEGFADGFAQGHAKAILDGQHQIDEFLQNQGLENARGFVKLFETAQARLESAEQGIAQDVLALACELAKNVLRQELSVNPGAIQPVIRDALSVMIGDSKCVRVRLNPADIERLQDTVRSEFPEFTLSLVPDGSISRGGCLIESAGTVVDGTVEKRWMRTVASLGLDVPWEKLSDEK